MGAIVLVGEPYYTKPYMTTAVRYVVLGALFLIPFIPLYVANSLFFPFITGKGFAFRILVEVAVVGWGVLMLIEPKYRPRFSWTLVLYGALVAWMAVANFFAINAHKAFWSNYERMDGWVTLVHVFGLFLVAGSMFSADKLWRKWWLTFLGASAFIGLYGLLQVAGVFTINQGGVRVDATMGNAAYLAAYLLFVVAAATWQAFTSKGWLRYGLFALAAVQVFLLFLTATRGALLGAVGATLLGALLWLFSTKGKARRYGIGLAVGVLVLVGGFVLARDSAFVQNDPTLARLASISLEEGSPRLAIWSMALDGAMERPLTGWGQEGFNYIFNTNYEPSMYLQEPWFDRAHNIYLDWLVAGGIPALLLFLALLGSAVVVIYRKGDRQERVFLLAAVAAYAFQGLFVFDNLFTYVPLAAILAMAHGLSSRPIQKLEDLPKLSEMRFQAIALPIGAAVGIALIVVVNVPSMRAANDLIHAMSASSNPQVNLNAFQEALSRGSFANQEIREQMVSYAIGLANQQSVPREMVSTVADAAVSEMTKQAEIQPRDARIWVQLSNAYRAQGDFQGAREHVARAQELSPKKQSLYIEEGVMLIQAGEYGAAREAFYKAYELDTSFEELATYAAAGDILVGDKGTARTLLTERFGTTTVDSNIIMLAHYERKDYAEVYPILRQRIQNDPRNHTYYLQLAGVYTEAGKTEDARRVLRELIQERPDLSTQVSQMLIQMGQ